MNTPSQRILCALVWLALLVFAVLMGGLAALAVGWFASVTGYPRWVGGLIGTGLAYLVVLRIIKYAENKNNYMEEADQ